MKKYKIYYTYNGSGVATVAAKGKREAIYKFEIGDGLYQEGTGYKHKIDSIEKL